MKGMVPWHFRALPLLLLLAASIIAEGATCSSKGGGLLHVGRRMEKALIQEPPHATRGCPLYSFPFLDRMSRRGGRVLRLRGGRKRILRPWDEAYFRGPGGCSAVPPLPAQAKQGTGGGGDEGEQPSRKGAVLVDNAGEGGGSVEKAREVVLTELAARQQCTALDPSRVEGGDRGMENYVEWTRQKKSTDDELGITYYIHRRGGSGGLVKARWADFRVQEVCLRTGVPVAISDSVSLPPRSWSPARNPPPPPPPLQNGHY